MLGYDWIWDSEQYTYVLSFVCFQEMKVNWATSPSNQPKQDTSSKSKWFISVFFTINDKINPDYDWNSVTTEFWFCPFDIVCFKYLANVVLDYS